jgi:cytochrome c
MKPKDISFVKTIAMIALASLPLTLVGCGGGTTSAKPDVTAACAACHAFAKEAPRLTGPNLNNIIGTTAGTQAGYAYSTAMRTSGVVWTAETLDAFIAAPKSVIPGTRMGFAGVSDPAQRKAIIAAMQK